MHIDRGRRGVANTNPHVRQSSCTALPLYSTSKSPSPVARPPGVIQLLMLTTGRYGFLLPDDQIIPNAEEMVPAMYVHATEEHPTIILICFVW